MQNKTLHPHLSLNEAQLSGIGGLNSIESQVSHYHSIHVDGIHLYIVEWQFVPVEIVIQFFNPTWPFLTLSPCFSAA